MADRHALVDAVDTALDALLVGWGTQNLACLRCTTSGSGTGSGMWGSCRRGSPRSIARIRRGSIR